MSDNVKHPSHYTQFKMEPLEFLRANKDCLNFLQVNIIKYVCRYKLKNGLEDLEKAQNYLNMLIEDWHRENDKPKTTTARARDPRECSSECTGRCAGCTYDERHR